MPDANGLLRAILDERADEAETVLQEALEAEVDPLRWCALRLGIAEADVMQRVARWADLAYFHKVPIGTVSSYAPSRLERLAEARMVRLRLLDRDVAFAAPDFFSALRLRRMVDANPAMKNTVCLVPRQALHEHLVGLAQEALMDGARQNLTRKWPLAVAQLDLTAPVRWGALVLLGGLVLLVTLAPFAGQPWTILAWVALVVLPALIRIAALITPPPDEPPAEAGTDPAELPVYSVMVPLRDEANMVDQIAAAMRGLDYPASRLEIVFIVEARSPETIRRVRPYLADPRFSLITVPDGPPRTKPKALDFALPMVTGEFVVVFDAEDRPEPDQLRRVLGQFRARPDIDCIQAQLTITNSDHGWLQALFAAEYAAQFSIIVPALARWGAVTPLGGTSNHFRTSTLRALGGWDAYNVAEDADLGVRMARRGLKTGTTTSRTYEDAPLRLRTWIGQRTRWMKGWLQTLVVHNRRPHLLWKDLGWRGAALFEILILGMILSPFLHIALAGSLTFSLWWGMVGWAEFPRWHPLFAAMLLVGYGAAFFTNYFGLLRIGQLRLLPALALLTAYWLLIGVATARAAIEFGRQPFYWFKTPHDTVRRAPDRAARAPRPLRKPVV